MAAVRPMVTVQSVEGEATEQVPLPAVFSAPIRPDIVQKVHTDMNKNHRQAYAVKFEAGMDTAAESWGTGRAVSRIPRVPGGGTHRAGQGAFGNMCRGGRMFAPTKVWRKWHRKINLNQKRYAVASALAASAVPALVMARGHKVEQCPEIPLVLSEEAAAITKTSAAVKALKALGAEAELEKCKASKNIRAGKGKMRNRRYVMRKGPLVVFDEDSGISKAFRNIPGVEVASVRALNLLQLAPGGHLGRMVVFTKGAFVALDSIFGSTETESEVKKGYKLPRTIMTNPDVARLINSDEVQTVVTAPKETAKPHSMKKNPLKNLGAMLKLNPYAAELKKAGITKKSAVKPASKAVGKAFLKKMATDSTYVGPDYDYFAVWLGTAQKA